MTEANPFLPKDFGDLPGGSMLVGNSLSDTHSAQLDGWRKDLIASGDEGFADPSTTQWMRHQFADPRLIDGLATLEQESGVPVTEYLRHSHRYNRWHSNQEMFTPPIEITLSETLGAVALGTHPLNVHVDGSPRRHEEGHLLSLNGVRKAGIDPSKVLFYRVTQPADGAKPEYYWTSDALEVRTGLRSELGHNADTAVVLVSTLEEIAKNGGLIDDINDDQGHAVRQASFDSFDQQRSLFTFPRQEEVK